MNPCIRHCPGYKKCIGYEWYSYGDIKFCDKQVEWIILYSEKLSNGEWPDPPQHLDIERTNKRFSNAPYERIVSVIAEIRRRVRRCGQDGQEMWYQIQKGIPLNDNTKCAFYYITGYKTKREPYRQFKYDRRKCKKFEKPIDKQE